MELGTFGAVLTFAIDSEERASEFYSNAVPRLTGESAAVFAELARARSKRTQVVERTRRENVAEMILEPVFGLHEEEYQFQADIPADVNAAELVARTIDNEARTERFYLDASERIGLGEVARIFRRLARESVDHKAKLESLRSRA